MPASPAPRESTINLRSSANDKALIDRAAGVLGVSRSQFILDASRQRAESVLIDRTRFELAPEAFAAFHAALDAPLPDPAALRKLLSRKPAWER